MDNRIASEELYWSYYPYIYTPSNHVTNTTDQNAIKYGIKCHFHLDSIFRLSFVFVLNQKGYALLDMYVYSTTFLLESMQELGSIPCVAASWNFSLIALTNLNNPLLLFNSWINSLVSFTCGSQCNTEVQSKNWKCQIRNDFDIKFNKSAISISLTSVDIVLMANAEGVFLLWILLINVTEHEFYSWQIKETCDKYCPDMMIKNAPQVRKVHTMSTFYSESQDPIVPRNGLLCSSSIFIVFIPLIFTCWQNFDGRSRWKTRKKGRTNQVSQKDMMCLIQQAPRKRYSASLN